MSAIIYSKHRWPFQLFISQSIHFMLHYWLYVFSVYAIYYVWLADMGHLGVCATGVIFDESSNAILI